MPVSNNLPKMRLHWRQHGWQVQQDNAKVVSVVAAAAPV